MNVNPRALAVWDQISKAYPYVKNEGIWGDAAHRARKSDHNTGDAIDLGVPSIERGTPIADELVKNAAANGAKYVIFNNQIWNPAQGWHPYNGANPHTGHVHISFLRDDAGPESPVVAAAPPAQMPEVPQELPQTSTDISGLLAPQVASVNPFAGVSFQAPKIQTNKVLRHTAAPNKSASLAQNLPDLFFQQ